MSSELIMDSGVSGKTKLMILGGVVVAFAMTIGILTRPDKPTATAGQAVARSAQTMPTASDVTPATPDTQTASNGMTPQTAVRASTDAISAEPGAIVANQAPVTAVQVAADTPAPAVSGDAEMEAQNSRDGSDASRNDNNINAPEQQAATQTAVSQPRPVVRPPPPPAIVALHPWWRDPATAQGFDVQYVGQAVRERALVFRFSKNIANAQMAAQHIHVIDDKGEAASGVWAVGNNPYVLVYQGVSNGRYMVSIDAALASASGATLGSPLQGPVYVN